MKQANGKWKKGKYAPKKHQQRQLEKERATNKQQKSGKNERQSSENDTNFVLKLSIYMCVRLL